MNTFCINSNMPSVGMSEAIQQVRDAMRQRGIDAVGQQSQLVVNSDCFVWMPDSLYEAGLERQYLGAVCDIPTGTTLYVDHNAQVQAHCIFAVDSTWVNAFRIAVPGIVIRCQHSLYANEALFRRSDLKSLVLVQLREGMADYMVLCNKKLLLSNTFAATTTEEAVYHALNLSQQLHLAEADMEVLLCGKVDRPEYGFFARFFPKVDLYREDPLKQAVLV